MIRYSEQRGIISPSGIKSRTGKNTEDIVIPEICVGVYSHHLFEYIIDYYPDLRPTQIGYINTANCERDVYKINFKGTPITFYIAGIGGPLIAGDIGDLVKHGAKKFIYFGNCGVLDSNIEDCSIIIPTKAFRDEGTSQHYIPDSELIDLNPKYIPEFEAVLDSFKMNHTKGYTWTTDAIYRETEEKRDYYKANGGVCVEMEASIISAVTKFYGVDHFTFFYAGDNLDAVEWEARSISGLTKFEQKKLIPFLAFELAHKIDSLSRRD